VTESILPKNRLGPLVRYGGAWLAAIIDSSDDAIVSKTLDGIITSWNRGAERMFGYSAEEAVGQHISLIIPNARRTEEDQNLHLAKPVDPEELRLTVASLAGRTG
jgi:PAS domain S-box-containing protein